MLNNKFNHIIYKPKNTLYNIVAMFNEEKYGNVIGYASREGEVFFRLSSDLDNFTFVDSVDFVYNKELIDIEVKFKLNGEWKNYIWSNNKLINKKK